jgi:predicted nucleic-acid-binding protein
MRAIDTNVLVRLAVGDDDAQVMAAERFVEGGVWVSHLVLLELIWVLREVYGRGPRQQADVIAGLLEHRSLVVQDAFVVQRALTSFRRRPRVQFSDHLILEVARQAGHMPLGTFDRALAREEGAQLISSR